MQDYKTMYSKLFGALCDALEEMDKQNFGRAKEILQQASLACEAQYMGEES